MNQNTLWLPRSWWHYKHNFFEFLDWCDEVYEPYQTVLKNHYKEISHKELYQELQKNSAKMFSSIGVLYSYKSIEAVAKILIDVRLRAMLNSANLDEAKLKYYDWIHQVIIRNEIHNRFELNLLSREYLKFQVLSQPESNKNFRKIYDALVIKKVGYENNVDKCDLQSELDEKLALEIEYLKKEWENNKGENFIKLLSGYQPNRIGKAMNRDIIDYIRKKQTQKEQNTIYTDDLDNQPKDKDNEIRRKIYKAIFIMQKDETDIDKELEHKELLMTIDKIKDKLTENEIKILNLYMEDMSQVKIAEELDVSKQYVFIVVKKIKNELCKLLK